MSWNGTAWIGMGVLVYWGAFGKTDPHHHGAHQLIFLPNRGNISVIAADTVFADPEVLVIPSGVTHALLADELGAMGITAFVDPDTTWGSRIRQRVRIDEPRSWPAQARSLIAEWPLDEIDHTNAHSLAQYLSASSSSGTAELHPYVHHALTVVTGRLTERTALSDVAADVGVSSSHLSRLWRQELGLSFNAWLRWSRLREAARLMSFGANVTDAANAAGFADGAHANRVCREMFGLPPLILSRGVTVI